MPRAVRCGCSVDQHEALKTIRLLKHRLETSQRSEGLPSQDAALHAVAVEDSEQIGNQTLRGDLVGGKCAGSRTPMVVPDATPPGLHELERFLPQLPTTNPPTVRYKGARTGPEIDSVEQETIGGDEHAENYARSFSWKRGPLSNSRLSWSMSSRQHHTQAGRARFRFLVRASFVGVATLVGAACSTTGPSKSLQHESAPTTLQPAPSSISAAPRSADSALAPVVQMTTAIRTTTAEPIAPPQSTTWQSTTSRPKAAGAIPGSFEAGWNPTVAGLLTFRGDANRRFYGLGPVPDSPEVSWSYPKGSKSLCRRSTAKGETKTWCGAGWTGQPTVHERDGHTWLIFNAYDGAVHFLDAETGEEILPPFVTGDIIKGTVTVDPDGYPIVYSGSRDNYFRAIAIDREDLAVELWRLSADAVSPTKWNNDWDGSALVLDDYLLEGGENSQFHVVKLNRTYGHDGLVTLDPHLVFNTPAWDDELLADLAGRNPQEVSIENSVAVDGDTVFFANSGGLVQGWDLAPLRSGGVPNRVFRFWTGDDTDATLVVDAEGFLYAASEYERETQRSHEVGQLMKLDPRNPANPLVWSYHDPGALARPKRSSSQGIWSTPAIYNGTVIISTNGGRVVGLDQSTGAVLWELRLPGPLWQSPVVVDETLLMGDCHGVLHAYDVTDPTAVPVERWSISLGGCIEATPAVWKGSVYLPTRGGKVFALR